MKKVWKMFFALVLAPVLLAGCTAAPAEQIVADADLYSVVSYSDSFVLRMKSELSNGTVNSGGAAKAPSEVFAYPSLSAMKTAVTEGKFTEKQLAYIQKSFAKNEKGEVKLFDMNKLCDIVLPQGAEVTEIRWTGKNYSFSFETEDFSGKLRVTDKESMEMYAQRGDMTKTNMKVLKTEDDPSRNAKIYYVEGAAAVQKYTQYTISGEYGTFTVSEADPVPEAELSLIIRYWGEYNGVYFDGQIVDPAVRPTYEWFQNFGLKPYVEAKTP